MKYLSILLILVSAFSFSSAQSFRQGELAVSPGLGLIGPLGAYNSPVQLIINAEYGLDDVFGVGGFLGFRYINGSLNGPTGSNAINTAFGLRATGHFIPGFNKFLDMSIDDSKVDVYITVLTGYEIKNPQYPAIRAFIFPRPIVGAKYYLTDPLAVWVELGLGAFALFNGGITLRL
ncbi:MAG: hypothetical protein KDD99_10305 [Bacteroidetes bacterium]|nr:hypothetical protein [Bacteroidota bacterium]